MLKKLLKKNGGHESFACNSHLHLFCILLLVALLFVFGALSAYLFQKTRLMAKQETDQQTLTLIGEATLSVKPTIAMVQAGLQTTAPTVPQAVSENTEKMNSFLSELPLLGIEDRDRKTITYSIQPQYEYSRLDHDILDKARLVGYSVFNTVQLKVRNLEKVSDVLAAIGNTGLNQVGSFSFVVDDPATAKNQAMEAAIANAQEKAGRFARVTGSRIGGIVSFFEVSESIDGMPAIHSAMPMMIKSQESPKQPITEGGEQEIKAVVNVTYTILR